MYPSASRGSPTCGGYNVNLLCMCHRCFVGCLWTADRIGITAGMSLVHVSPQVLRAARCYLVRRPPCATTQTCIRSSHALSFVVCWAASVTAMVAVVSEAPPGADRRSIRHSSNWCGRA
eukprot:scaffold6600_cov125-Isochrysis_galbana.AAC.6